MIDAVGQSEGILHVWIVASKGEHVWRGYQIRNVNAYTSGLSSIQRAARPCSRR
jgi:hypothetical protein